ncbi:Uncharacterised protein [Streptococcus pneumoniae]|nr:Uncharacterised protein [Streptococcus pneumoniae]
MGSTTVRSEGVGIHLGRESFLFNGGGWYSQMYPSVSFKVGVFLVHPPPLVFNISYILLNKIKQLQSQEYQGFYHIFLKTNLHFLIM